LKTKNTSFSFIFNSFLVILITWIIIVWLGNVFSYTPLKCLNNNSSIPTIFQ
jgi:hypothetical protein